VLVRQVRSRGVALTSPQCLLKSLTKTVIETALDEEISEHLGYDTQQTAGRSLGNSATPGRASLGNSRKSKSLRRCRPARRGPSDRCAPRP
jgi:transposase-like protein